MIGSSQVKRYAAVVDAHLVGEDLGRGQDLAGVAEVVVQERVHLALGMNSVKVRLSRYPWSVVMGSPFLEIAAMSAAAMAPALVPATRWKR